jgi:hypothetical protein
MSDDRDGYRSPYAPGAPDPTLLTRAESQLLESRLRREMDEKLAALKELRETIFVLFEKQMHQYKVASKEAVDAALQSQKESVSKSEISTGKQLEALDRRISENKERLDRGEGVNRGAVDTRSERRADVGSFAAIAALVLGIINILIIIIVAIVAVPHSPPVPVTVQAVPALPLPSSGPGR